MKLCKDCRWIELEPLIGLNGARCGHPSAVAKERSPVTGEMKYLRWTCQISRGITGLPGHCGPEGRLFEPKQGGRDGPV